MAIFNVTGLDEAIKQLDLAAVVLNQVIVGGEDINYTLHIRFVSDRNRQAPQLCQRKKLLAGSIPNFV